MLYSWDWLFAEGFTAAQCARIMGVHPRVAYAELANAKDKARDAKRRDMEAESRRLQNPVYQGFHVHGVPWNVRKTVSDSGVDRTVDHCG